MKNVILILILQMYAMHSYAQSDSIPLDEMKLEILKTNKLYMANQLDLRGYDFSNTGLNQELYAAALSKRKSIKSASTGGILIVLGLATMITSGAVAANNLLEESDTFAAGFLLGTAVGLASIPLFISSGKHKKDAEKHIKIAREMYGG